MKNQFTGVLEAKKESLKMVEKENKNKGHDAWSLSGESVFPLVIPALRASKSAGYSGRMGTFKQPIPRTETLRGDVRVDRLRDDSFFYERQLSGFTLIELLVVVLIIGILAAVALPKYQQAVEKSRATQALIIGRHLKDLERAFFLANGRYTNKFDELDFDVPAGGQLSDDKLHFYIGTYHVKLLENYNRVYIQHGGKPSYVFSIELDTENIICTAYTSDNYAGEGLCKSITGDLTAGVKACSEDYCRSFYWQ